jgi:hypothetical protein
MGMCQWNGLHGSSCRTFRGYRKPSATKRLSRRLQEWRLLFGAGSDFAFSLLRVERMFEKRRFQSTWTLAIRDRPRFFRGHFVR